MSKPTIEIPPGMRRPAEVERDELRKELAEARAEIERLKSERVEDATRLKNVFLEDYNRLKAVEDVVRNQDKLIAQMRQALRIANAHVCYKEAKEIINAALEAAERNNK